MQANSYGQKCSVNDECDQTKGLSCKEGICQCKDEAEFWREKSSTCGIF